MSESSTAEDTVQPASRPSEEQQGKECQPYTLRTSSDALDATSSYPPINNSAEETRRVEENLRRWEIAERQRRKAARESSQKLALPSFRASLPRQGRKPKLPSIGGLGAHTALQSQDTLPLRDINVSPTPSTSRSDSQDGHTADPFANPPGSLSPFSESRQEWSEPIPVSYRNETFVNSSKAGRPPPPKPLSLPPPRTPPPIASLSPMSQSSPTYRDSNDHVPQDTRWWHEWLCGCGEGPDRGGDNQAGRTNPFE